LTKARRHGKGQRKRAGRQGLIRMNQRLPSSRAMRQDPQAHCLYAAAGAVLQSSPAMGQGKHQQTPTLNQRHGDRRFPLLADTLTASRQVRHPRSQDRGQEATEETRASVRTAHRSPVATAARASQRAGSSCRAQTDRGNDPNSDQRTASAAGKPKKMHSDRAAARFRSKSETERLIDRKLVSCDAGATRPRSALRLKAWFRRSQKINALFAGQDLAEQGQFNVRNTARRSCQASAATGNVQRARVCHDLQTAVACQWQVKKRHVPARTPCSPLD